MNTNLGYSKKTLTDTDVLLSGGGNKPLSEFLGSISWDATNRKLLYTPVGGTATDLVTFSTQAITNADLSVYVPKIAGTGSVVAHAKSIKDWDGCKIVIPGGSKRWMSAFTVRIYVGYNYTDLVFSGYHYGGNHWSSGAVRCIGGTKNYKVVMGYVDNNTLYIWFGETGGGKLGYGGVSIMNLHAGHDDSTDWYSGWTFSNVAYASLTNKLVDTTTVLPAMANHTHSLSIATDTGTNALTLTASTKYKLTAGGSTFIFTTPADTTYSTVSKTAAGLCPLLPNENTTTKFLRLDGTWNDTYFAIENLTDWASTTTTTASSIAFTKVWWKIAPTSSNQVYGIGIHPTNGLLYYIYNNKGTYSATAYSANTGNSWRNVYVGGTSKVGTGTGTKAINYVQGNNVTITYKAAGTGTDQSGSADYFNIEIAATNTWRGILDNLTSSSNTTESLSAKLGYLLANGSARDSTKVKLDAGAAEQTIKNSIGSLANGSIEIWRATYGGYAMIGFANGTTKTKLGMLGFSGVDTPIFMDTSNNEYTLVHEGNISTQTVANANNVLITKTATTTEYPILFGSSWTTSNDNQAIRAATVSTTSANNPLRICPGDNKAAGTEGNAYIVIGNNIAKSAANNRTGSIYLYGSTAYWGRIVPAAVTANRTYTFPNASGTVALTSDLSNYLPLTGGDLTGSVSIGCPSGTTDTRYLVVGALSAYNSGYEALLMVQGGAGNLYLFANKTAKGIYARYLSGYANETGKVIMSVAHDHSAVNFYGVADSAIKDSSGNNIVSTYKTKSSRWLPITYATANSTNFTTYLDSNDVNVHNAAHNELNLFRFYADSYANYNLPCVDSFSMVFSLDNQKVWFRALNFDARTTDIYTINKYNGTWKSWVKLLNSSNYSSYALPLSGGTLTGQLILATGQNKGFKFQNGTTFDINTTTDGGPIMRGGYFRFTNGTDWDYSSWAGLGYNTSAKTIYLGIPGDGTIFQKNTRVDTNGKLQLVNISDITLDGSSGNTYKVWHENNVGPGSELDADKLDNWHLSDIIQCGYVTTDSNLSSFWLKAWEMSIVNKPSNDLDMTWLVLSAYLNLHGILHFRIRLMSATGTTPVTFVLGAWEVTGNIPLDKVRLYCGEDGKCQIWMNVQGQYGVFNYTIIKKTWRWGYDVTKIGTCIALNYTTALNVPALATDRCIQLSGSSATFVLKSGDTMTGHLKIGGTKDLGLPWDKGVIAGADGHDKVVLTYLASSTNGAVIGAHNSALSAWSLLNISGTQLVFRTGETERMRLNSSGNLGIGTSSPSYNLDVNGTINSNSDVTIRNTTAVLKSFKIINSVGEMWVGVNTTGEGYTWVNSNKPYHIGTNATTRIFVTAGGSVGVGTTSPSYKLDVNGSGRFVEKLYANKGIVYGTGTATSLASLDSSKGIIFATVTSSQSNMSLSSALATGQALTVLVYNNSASSIAISIPSSLHTNCVSVTSMDGTTLICPSYKFLEMSILCYDTNKYLISSKWQ